MELLKYWYDFRALPYSDELLIGIGAMLLIVGVLRIIKSSATMLIWVTLSGLGLAGISQGLDRNPLQLVANQTNPVSGYINTGKELSADALSILCRKLDETELLQLDQNTN